MMECIWVDAGEMGVGARDDGLAVNSGCEECSASSVFEWTSISIRVVQEKTTGLLGSESILSKNLRYTKTCRLTHNVRIHPIMNLINPRRQVFSLALQRLRILTIHNRSKHA